MNTGLPKTAPAVVRTRYLNHAASTLLSYVPQTILSPLETGHDFFRAWRKRKRVRKESLSFAQRCFLARFLSHQSTKEEKRGTPRRVSLHGFPLSSLDYVLFTSFPTTFPDIYVFSFPLFLMLQANSLSQRLQVVVIPYSFFSTRCDHTA